MHGGTGSRASKNHAPSRSRRSRTAPGGLHKAIAIAEHRFGPDSKERAGALQNLAALAQPASRGAHDPL